MNRHLFCCLNFRSIFAVISSTLLYYHHGTYDSFNLPHGCILDLNFSPAFVDAFGTGNLMQKIHFEAKTFFLKFQHLSTFPYSFLFTSTLFSFDALMYLLSNLLHWLYSYLFVISFSLEHPSAFVWFFGTSPHRFISL